MLLAACGCGLTDVVTDCLKNGVNEVNEGRRETPLIIACKDDRMDVVRILLYWGAETRSNDVILDTERLPSG